MIRGKMSLFVISYYLISKYKKKKIPSILHRLQMAKVSICGYVGQAKLQFSDFTPFGGLITRAAV